MPNWAEGTLKIRGTRQDIKNFLKGALQPCQTLNAFLGEKLKGEIAEPPKVDIKEDEWDFTMKSEDGFYIKGCRRAFVGDIEWWFDDKHTEVLIIDDFKQAWGVDPKPFAELSKEFNVDIKIYVFERGMEFNQEVEIHKGEIIKSNEIEFDDYKWECLFPNLGG